MPSGRKNKWPKSSIKSVAGWRRASKGRKQLLPSLRKYKLSVKMPSDKARLRMAKG